MTQYREYPELIEGVRVQYYDKDEKIRTGRITNRYGNTITILGALNRTHRIRIEKVIGYWKKGVRSKPKNLINLER